eukprot:NODE_83_length_22684_cov_0.307934.p18 type:complete len:106 gc:universal NODE_83_length_22684_cov_0.307934:17011-16694(-)
MPEIFIMFLASLDFTTTSKLSNKVFWSLHEFWNFVVYTSNYDFVIDHAACIFVQVYTFCGVSIAEFAYQNFIWWHYHGKPLVEPKTLNGKPCEICKDMVVSIIEY